MRLILGADLHGHERTDEDFKLSVRLYRTALELAVKHSCAAVVWLGDLLHYKYDKNTRTLIHWNRISQEFKHIQTILIQGNHDLPFVSREETPLELIYNATLIKQPLFVPLGYANLGYLPWLPEKEYKAAAEQLSLQALDAQPVPSFLFSHVSLQEGYVSGSGRQEKSPVRAEDLHPSAWAHIYLGDYHGHQQVGENITYLGSPRATSFSDWNCAGLFLFEISDRSWSTKCLGLPGKWPQFIKLRIPFGAEPRIPNYNSYNHYQIEAPLYMHSELLRQYKNIRLKKAEDELTVPISQRMIKLHNQRPLDIYRRWASKQGLNPFIYEPIAMEYITSATSQITDE